MIGNFYKAYTRFSVVYLVTLMSDRCRDAWSSFLCESKLTRYSKIIYIVSFSKIMSYGSVRKFQYLQRLYPRHNRGGMSRNAVEMEIRCTFLDIRSAF